jgi:serine/threonine protein kinase
MAPEVVMQKTYDGKLIDIYSMGICLFVMLTGKYPFECIADALSGTIHMPNFISQGIFSIVK